MARAECLRDEFAQEFLKSNDLAVEETRQKLILMANVIYMNTSEIECRYASLRKMLTRVQANLRDVEDLTTDWVAHRYRRRFVSVLGQAFERVSKATDSGGHGDEGIKAVGTAPTAPGTWRVFVA